MFINFIITTPAFTKGYLFFSQTLYFKVVYNEQLNNGVSLKKMSKVDREPMKVGGVLSASCVVIS